MLCETEAREGRRMTVEEGERSCEERQPAWGLRQVRREEGRIAEGARGRLEERKKTWRDEANGEIAIAARVVMSNAPSIFPVCRSTRCRWTEGRQGQTRRQGELRQGQRAGF